MSSQLSRKKYRQQEEALEYVAWEDDVFPVIGSLPFLGVDEEQLPGDLILV